MAKIYGKAPNRYIRHPVTGEKLTVGNTNAQADLSYQEVLAAQQALEDLTHQLNEQLYQQGVSGLDALTTLSESVEEKAMALVQEKRAPNATTPITATSGG